MKMWVRLCVLVAVLASVMSVAMGKLFTSNVEFQKTMWGDYKNDYQKSYETMDQENAAFSAFINNLQLIDQRNAEEAANNGTAIHGISFFSDLTQEEFEHKYLKSDPSLRLGQADSSEYFGEPDLTLGAVDWTGKCCVSAFLLYLLVTC
jgi:hypothetical protein